MCEEVVGVVVTGKKSSSSLSPSFHTHSSHGLSLSFVWVRGVKVWKRESSSCFSGLCLSLLSLISKNIFHRPEHDEQSEEDVGESYRDYCFQANLWVESVDCLEGLIAVALGPGHPFHSLTNSPGPSSPTSPSPHPQHPHPSSEPNSLSKR